MKLNSPLTLLGKFFSALMLVLTVFSASSLSAALALPGDLDTTFNYGAGTRGTNGTVYAIAVQSDGKVIIGGSFNQYNGSAVPTGLIRLNTDGSLDTTFNNGGAGIGGGTSTIRALAIDSGGNVIVGGNFTSYNGAAVPTGLIRVSSTGALDATFNNGGSGVGGGWTSSMVYTVAIRPSDGKIVVGGDFTSYNGDSNIPNLVMLVNTNGTPDISFNYNAGSGILNTFYPVPGLCGPPVVYSLALDSSERIVVGGNCFNAHNSAGTTDVLASDNIQRLNANGTLDTTFNYGPPAAALDGFDSTVYVVAVQPSDNKVIAGGIFTSYNHNANIPDGIIRINATDGSIDTGFTYGAGTGIVNTINSNTKAVFSLAIQTDGKVIVGGDWFNAFNDDGITNDTDAADNLLRLNADGTVDTTFSYGPTRGSNAAVHALAINPSATTPYNTRIWVGGSFTSYSGDANAPDRIERLSFEGVTTTTITSDNPDPSVYGQTVTVTYTVTSPSGTPTGNVTVTDGVDSCVGTVAAGSCDITLTTLGSRTLTATYAGDSNFAGSVSTGVSHQVDPAPLTVTADAGQSKVYGTIDPTFTYSITSGALVGSDTLSGALSRDPGENVGLYAITQGTLSAGSNYSLTFVSDDFEITTASLTVSADAGQSKVYGTIDPTFTYSITSGALVGSDTLSGALSRDPGENVGLYAITQGTLSAGSNYNLTFVSDDFEITTASLTVTADAGQSKVYGTIDPTFTYSITSGALVGSDTLSGALSRDPGENVGLYAITQGTLSAGSNYSLTFVSDDFEITTASLTITANNDSKTYDGNPYSGGNGVTYSGFVGSDDENNALSGTLTYSGTSQGAVNQGTYAITPGGLTANNGNYNIAFNDGTLTISATDLTVTADAGQSKVYGTIDPTFTYSITSGALVGSDTLSGALSRDPGENVGLYAITQGTLSAGSNYNLTFVSDDFEITTASLTVSADAGQSKVYGTIDPTFTYSITSGALVGSDTLSGALSRDPGENVGLYAITQGTLSAGSNYNLTFVSDDFEITTASLTVTADAGQSKVYGTIDPTFTYSITSGALVGSDTLSGALSRDPGENVGLYAITQGNLSAGSNYSLTFVSDDFEITAAGLTITANNDSKTYDGNPYSGGNGVTYSGFVGSDDENNAISGTLTYSGTSQGAVNQGTYAITPGGLTANNGNYNITFNDGTLTISVATITITANNDSKTYDGNPYSGGNGVTYSGFVGSDDENNALSGTLTYSGTSQGAVNQGTYAITPGGLTANNGNYNITFNDGTLTISATDLTVTADAGQSKVYGTIDPTFTYSITSGALVGSDTLSGALSRDPGENVGLYAITQGTLSAGSNYNLTFVSDDFEITTASLTVSADAGQSKVYGTIDPTFTYSITSGALVGSDTLSGALSRDPGENVGLYAITQGTLSAGSNYNLTFVSDDFEITTASLTVTADAGQSKVYGTIDPTFTYSITSGALVGSDTLSGALSRDPGENVGLYAITQGTLSAGSNYSLAFVSDDFEITTASLTITANNDSKTYDGNPYSGGNGVTYSGFVGSDDENNALSGTLTYSGTSQGAVNQGTYAITPGGLTANNGNYNITFNDGTLTISASTPGITWNNPADIVYGTSLSGTQLNATSPVAGTFTYTPPSGTVLNAGNSQNLHVDFVPSDAVNYSNASADVSINVTKATLTVIADNQNIDFGDPDPAFTFIYSGFVPGDSATDIDTPPTCTVTGPHTNAGTYPIVCSGATDDNYTFSYVNGTLSVGLASQTITITTPAPTDAAPGSSFVVAATASSGLPVTYSASGACTNVGATFTMSAVGSGTCTVLYDQAGNANYAPAPQLTETVNGILVIVTNGINSNEPTNGDYIAELETVTVGVTQLLVTFSEDVSNPNNTDPDSVTNTNNYILVADNGDGIQTTTCNVNTGGGVIGGDLTIAINSVTYTNNGGSGPFIATVNINGGASLPVGIYRFIVCGTTSITDLLGTPLAGNGTTIGTDFIRNFSVARAVTRIPDTGFPQNQVTTLPVQSAEKAYSATNMWIEIPKLGVKMSIVGVPSTVEGWDVTWLGNNAGWLEGSAFPTWNGNSAITAHVWDAYNRPGPFARLKDLKYGDQIKIHAFGQIYIYEIRESTTISPNNISTVLKHEEKSWITLITCEDYLESSKTYLSRRMVRAVLVKVTAE